MRTAVLGLGNPVVTDDRAGLAVAQHLARLLSEEPVPGVDVLESTRGGLELMDLLSGYQRAILVDCIISDRGAPGAIHRLTLEHVEGSARLISAHEVSVGDVFRLARWLGTPMPPRVEIIGIEGADVATLSERMTPQVEAAVAQVTREIWAALHE